jgi:hypothetical protein
MLFNTILSLTSGLWIILYNKIIDSFAQKALLELTRQKLESVHTNLHIWIVVNFLQLYQWWQTLRTLQSTCYIAS